MVDTAFVIRTGPSGPDMPQGTPGYVLTVQPDGLSVKPEPAPGGSLSPLTKVAYADAAASPGGNGSIGSPFVSPQEAHDANFSLCYLAPGTYGALAITNAAFACQGLAPPGITGTGDVSIGAVTVSGGGSNVGFQSCTFDGITDTSAGCIITLVDAVSTTDIAGTINTTLRTGSAVPGTRPGIPSVRIQGAVTGPIFSAALAYTTVTGALACDSSRFTAIFSSVNGNAQGWDLDAAQSAANAATNTFVVTATLNYVGCATGAFAASIGAPAFTLQANGQQYVYNGPTGARFKVRWRATIQANLATAWFAAAAIDVNGDRIGSTPNFFPEEIETEVPAVALAEVTIDIERVIEMTTGQTFQPALAAVQTGGILALGVPVTIVRSSLVVGAP